MLKNRKTWARVVEVVRAGEMPPANKPQPPLAEKEQFATIVEGIFARADSSGVVDPGRVTMRRLNKTEYNNTIRDLCYVDFDASEDFPSDDIGHGFDNIGDVLSLPPVLMERYLAAAESAMNRAILPNPPPPSKSTQNGRYLEPASGNTPVVNRHRVVSFDPKGDAVKTGPVHTPFKVRKDGEYTFRTKLFAETKGKTPVKVALLAKCDPDAPGVASDADVKALAGAAVESLRPFVILKVVEVTARDAKSARTIEANVPPGIGITRGAVALVAPANGEPAPKVHVEWLQLEGPLDPRPVSQLKLLGGVDEARPEAERTRVVVDRFVTRAYRRPATPDEVDRVVALVDAARADGKTWEAAVQFAFTGVLCSPKFLFRIEADPDPAAAGPHPVGEYPLASRLSYFLWATMPDEELFRLAAAGNLSANLDAQARRMLADPRAEALVDRFVVQWLQLERLQSAQVDPDLFPKFDEPMKRAMLEETRLFFREIVRDDRSVVDILDGKYTYLNDALAGLYGIKDTAGNLWSADPKKVKPKPGGMKFPRRGEFVRVDLSNTPRGGVLTQASVLTVTSLPTRTSPVKRGKWVLEQLLGTPPPPPPPDVPELEEAGKAITAGTLRERLEEHRKNPACANCHAKMDPIGFGLENFDAIGGYRWKDGDADIDASAVLDGKAFRGPDELRAVLAAKNELFVRCLAEKMLTYALGRGLEYYDKRAVDGVVARMTANDFKFSSLVLGVATSDPFRLRRGKDQP